MLDIRFVRENSEAVKENIRKKFQDEKLPLVDEAVALDEEVRRLKGNISDLRANRNKLSKQIGQLMAQKKLAEAEETKQMVTDQAAQLAREEQALAQAEESLNKIMLTLPQMIAADVPIGKSDAENVEREVFGEAKPAAFEIPYHAELMERFQGLDLDAARRVAGNGFYYLMGDIARLHSAVLSYARDFMINKGFTYCIPPYMIRSAVVDGVMSFAELNAMMYKIEDEDLYLIGTSEHSMIGKFADQILEGRGSALRHDLVLAVLPQGKGRPRHRGARRVPHPPV